MKRYFKSVLGLPGKQEIEMVESKGGAWVLWEEVRALLGDDWNVCARCGNLELVSNLYKVILANDLSEPNYGIDDMLPPIIDNISTKFSITLLLCPHCRTSWAKATRKWFNKET